MKKFRETTILIVRTAAFALLSLLIAGTLRAQEIRVLAEPNQSIQMGRGGYVCEGHITHTPIDATANWTYEMVQCTGPIYDARDYAALNAKLSRDELVKTNAALDQLNTTASATLEVLNRQAQSLNTDLRAAIEKHFQDLPHDVLQSAAIQNLKKNLIDYVDQRLPRTPVNTPPSSRSNPPVKSPQSPAPPSP